MCFLPLVFISKMKNSNLITHFQGILELRTTFPLGKRGQLEVKVFSFFHSRWRWFYENINFTNIWKSLWSKLSSSSHPSGFRAGMLIFVMKLFNCDKNSLRSIIRNINIRFDIDNFSFKTYEIHLGNCIIIKKYWFSEKRFQSTRDVLCWPTVCFDLVPKTKVYFFECACFFGISVSKNWIFFNQN